jgi:hypothetical protein
LPVRPGRAAWIGREVVMPSPQSRCRTSSRCGLCGGSSGGRGSQRIEPSLRGRMVRLAFRPVWGS